MFELELSGSGRVLYERTLEVNVPRWLRDAPEASERMPLEAWQVLDLHHLGDTEGLAELGITVRSVTTPP